jgi:selenide,water dikinase
LAQVLCHLQKPQHPDLLVGIETSDDAAVYKINDNIALIQTVDFFTPVVDDPYIFGQIAAANALSDVYAMGGDPILALNIVCFPDCLDPLILSEILRGGQDKVIEAGAVLAGGHSVSDDEPKYGLSVAGFVDPLKIMTNDQAKPGDVLILTKPLGVGIINTAIKAEMASETAIRQAVLSMSTLNRIGKEATRNITGVHSITDITGFGLLGHAIEMAEGSKVTFRIRSTDIPYISEAKEYANIGLIPAGSYKNRDFFARRALISEHVPTFYQDILFDPQTSGGLLISVAKENSKQLLDNLKSSPVAFACIGEVELFSGKYVIVE